MSVADFLLELRCEEIPARMQAKASADLARLFSEALAGAGLSAASITSYVTPRRLTLVAHDLPLATQAVSEEFKGPRTSAPEQALDGFLRKTGLTRDQLEDRDGVWFATVEKPGRATAEVLAEVVPAIVRAFPWPKSMRWGQASRTTESLRWVRPLQGVIALLGGDVVPIEIDGTASGRETMGHRFHSSGAISIESAATYADALRAAYVIVDQVERARIIAERASALAAEAGLVLVEDAGLVAENAGLTEWPVPLLGRFDPAFLEVPPEVIQLTLRINQKYFVLKDAAGKLANAFICTANIEATDGGAAIVAGNGKVLAARLSDARFFWEQDKKTPLAKHAEKLARITFHEKLGTVADKVERVAKLARWLCEEGIVKPHPRHAELGSASTGAKVEPWTLKQVQGDDSVAEREALATLAEQAARLCKADLVTEMVGEFPELQGLMGGYYARAEGLPDEVADAIRDHYKPVGQGDDVPTAPVTVAVSLADKLDTLVGFFAIGSPPTGSKDPFALRRAALANNATSLSQNLRFSLSYAIEYASYLFQFQYCSNLLDLTDQFVVQSIKYERQKSFAVLRDETSRKLQEFIDRGWPNDRAEGERRIGAWHRAIWSTNHWFSDWDEVERTVSEVINFLADRLKVQQREAGVRHDLIDAVFALGGEDDLVRLLARVKALQAFIETDEGANLLAGYKRAANILKKEGDSEGAPGGGYTLEPAEAALIAALDAAEPLATSAIEREDFTAAMAALAGLRAPIDKFFTDVTVNDADPAKRDSRLRLLTRIRAAVHKVADFSKIEG